MGVHIHLEVSKSVTKEEWAKVYEESLELVKAFPFAERGTIEYVGEKVACLVPTAEREKISRFGRSETVYNGWWASGDYETLCEGEDYYLPKYIVEQQAEPEKNAGDAFLGALPAYCDGYDDNPVSQHTYSLWGAKTQGEPYHMYLLAVACMIESRLGQKAFVYGDITKGQCEEAVEMANRHLQNPITVPARCDMDRWFHRVEKLPLEETEKLKVLILFYLGRQDSSLGEYIKEHFDKSVVNDYWQRTISGYPVGTIGFERDVAEYLEMGFGLEELCYMIKAPENEEEPYKEFIENVLQSKLNESNDKYMDHLGINPDQKEPYGVWSLMADSLMAGNKSRKAYRKIPMEEIKTALIRGLKGKCDAERIINDILKDNESNPDEKAAGQERTECAETVTSFVDHEMEQMKEKGQRYDIVFLEELKFYEKGNIISPDLEKALLKAFRFYNSLLEKESYKQLMSDTPEARCRYLIQENQYLLIRDTDWQHIFADIKSQPDAFSRYFPMVWIDTRRMNANEIVRAFVINDDLWKKMQELDKRSDE